jgi:hypothetical protein
MLIIVWKANDVQYLEARAEFPVCHETTCTNPAKTCEKKPVVKNGYTYQMCYCDTYNSGCRLGYRGPMVGGTAECVSWCTSPATCPELAWGGGQWVGSPPVWVVQAYQCIDCQ